MNQKNSAPFLAVTFWPEGHQSAAVSLFKVKNQKKSILISCANKNFTKNMVPFLASQGLAKNEAKPIQSNQINLSQSPSKDQNTRLIIHIKATFNNTLLTLTNFKGQVLTWTSAGSCGFKGARKGTPFAAQKVVEIFIKKSNDYLGRCNQIKIYVCGVGPGRENAIRGLGRSLNEAIQPKQKKRTNKSLYRPTSNKITLIREMTKIPHNGCRPAKKRRL